MKDPNHKPSGGRGRPARNEHPRQTEARANRRMLTISPEIEERAMVLMEAMAYGEFSGFVAQLIREKWATVAGEAVPPEVFKTKRHEVDP